MKGEESKLSGLSYHSLFEQASDPIMITDFDGNFYDVNESLCKLFGYKKEELLKMNIRNLIDPEHIKSAPMRFERLAQGEHVFSERRMMHKDGSIIEVEANVKKIDERFVLAIARDITERKRSEAILRESEFSFRKVTENDMIGVAWASPEGKVINANRTFCKLLGYSIEELKGVHFGELTHPEDTANELELLKEITDGKKDSYQIEKRYRRKNGTYIWVELSLSCFRDPQTKVMELFIGIVQDIDERKKAEQELRLSEQKYKMLFFKNPLPMFMLAVPDLHIIDVNEAAIEEYGYSREEFLTMSALDIRPEEDVKLLKDTISKEPDGITNFGIWRHVRKDGSMVKMEIISQRIMNEGRPVNLTMAHNVTEKILAEEKLQQSHKDLQLLAMHLQSVREDERTIIAREIHDELGQQLTGLKMDIAWINKKIPPDNTVVHEKIDRVLSLIDDTMKSVRHISSELRPNILDDLGIIDALYWQSDEFEKRTGVKCSFKSSFNEMEIKKDLSTGIFRVYQETLTNIARHAQASQINATFELENNDIVLKVQDNGLGFEEKEIKNKKTLGLLGMRERASMFGGKIIIKSEKGKGTAVTLQVPLNLIAEDI